ncbi:P-selectin glycoprotein ligand 1 [Sorex fumeus]|uniref:P-selectin glycoprotein ligand 1 n=1 Tax=Sorex fumeus TaxID=62283 RepID=UPI0024AD4A5B|nr:P-selectin glycoprotein ligand 1 [Sorex fumeus]
MRLQVLLLLTLLGPGCSLRLVPAKGSLDSPAARARRQAPVDEDPEDVEDHDYEYGTDPPEVLDKALTTLPHPSPVPGLGTPGQGHPVGARTQEPLPSGAAGSSREPSAVPVQPTPEATPTPEAPPTPKAPPTKEAPPTQRPPTETTTTTTTPTETTPPATTPAETTPTPPATTAAPEAQTTGAAATEALPHGRAIPETLSTKLPAVADPPTESTTAKAQTTLPAAPGGLTPAPGGDSSRQKNRASATPGGSVTPSSTRASDHIPVKQCLLAILILALVATVFLVCTVVLAVRLSRKTHMYPLRSYSPTEMVCISSLLPEGGGGGGGEGSGTTANGGPPTGKSADSKVEPGEEHEGDDLTLRSFLP